MGRAALLCLALAALAASPGALGSGPRQVLYVEETTTYEGGGALSAGEAKTFRFKVVEENVTRAAFRLRWLPETGAAFSLAAVDPSGRPVDAPVPSAPGTLRLVSGEVAPLPVPRTVEDEALEEALAAALSRAGQGEWRVSVRAEETPGGPVAFSLDVTVSRYRAVVLSVVTLQAAPAQTPRFWTPLLALLALAVAALGVALARPRRRSVSPPGDNTPSPTPEQGRCAPER